MIEKIAAFLLLILLLPFLLLISLSIYILSGTNPFFIQERGITLNKHRFRIYKFRTLFENNKNLKSCGNILRKKMQNESITNFSKFLRTTGLDELPQLINIIKGEMSFVGPRPLDIKDLKMIKENFSNFYKEREKISVLPGITGYWQIYREEDRNIKNLIELDKYYSKNKNLKLNLKIVFLSVIIFFRVKHTDSLIIESIEYPKLLILNKIESIG